MYFPLLQSFFPFVPTTLAVRTDVRPSAVVSAIRHLLDERFRGVVLASAAPFEQFVAEPLAQPRMNAFLLSAFAGAAVFLAAIGLLGVMLVMVRQRTREIGIRMALGATATEVSNMVLRRALAIAVIGIGVGLGGVLLTNRVLVAMLYEVSPTDVATYFTVVAVVLFVALVATFIPARLSARVNPVIALRADG